MAEATHVNETVDVSDVLLDPNVQSSLNTVLEKMPQLAQLMTALTKDEETLTSLVTVIDSLPTLAKLLHLVNRAYRGAEDVLTDGATLDGIVKMVQGYTQPAVSTIQKGREAFEAAKERADQDQKQYNIFAVLKLLKDPTVQKGLRFTQAMLDELNARKA